MTRKDFDLLDSNGNIACPDCGQHRTHPFPNCGCPTDFLNSVEVMPRAFVSPARPYRFTRHINRWHHTCQPVSA